MWALVWICHLIFLTRAELMHVHYKFIKCLAQTRFWTIIPSFLSSHLVEAGAQTALLSACCSEYLVSISASQYSDRCFPAPPAFDTETDQSLPSWTSSHFSNCTRGMSKGARVYPMLKGFLLKKPDAQILNCFTFAV